MSNDVFVAVNQLQGLGLAVAGLSSLFWTAAYLLVIRRAAIDRVPAMPLAALGANLAWELIFLYRTLAHGDVDVRLALLVPWAGLDLVIAWQCFRYGRQEHPDPFVKRNFSRIFIGTLVATFAVVLGVVVELEDAIGWYVAFGQNLMMSVLFVQMLLRRGGLAGQSVHIALCKLLGSFFAFLLALFWSPPSLHEHWAELLPTTWSPITPLLVVLYVGILVFDCLYVALLAARGREQGILVWNRL